MPQRIERMDMKKSFLFVSLALFLVLSPEAVAAPKVVGQDTSGVADSSDYIQQDAVGEAGMVPLYAADLKEGSYKIECETSSSMFPVPSCTLTVQDGKLLAEMVMGGHGYLYLFMGTGEEAAAAPEKALTPLENNAAGKAAGTVEIEALNKELPCSAFSKNKEKWYERTVVFSAKKLPREAVLVSDEELEKRGKELAAAEEADPADTGDGSQVNITPETTSTSADTSDSVDITSNAAANNGSAANTNSVNITSNISGTDNAANSAASAAAGTEGSSDTGSEVNITSESDAGDPNSVNITSDSAALDTPQPLDETSSAGTNKAFRADAWTVIAACLVAGGILYFVIRIVQKKRKGE